MELHVDARGFPLETAQRDTGKLSSADGFGTREFIDGNYIGRMSAAVLGIYGNSKEWTGLKKDADGGVTLYVQNESPGKELESNWLPAPKGSFWTVIRLYWPAPDALDSTWKAPALNKVK